MDMAIEAKIGSSSVIVRTNAVEAFHCLCNTGASEVFFGLITFDNLKFCLNWDDNASKRA